jgi:multicomponent Na+:H+ antiporter subunit A
VVLAPFFAMPLAAWWGRTRAAGMLALLPAALTLYFADAFRRVATSTPFTIEVPWAPQLGLTLAFHFDGLGLFFATLIAAVGTLIVVYGAAYFRGHAHAARFFTCLFAFMGAMLGVVLSDNVIALFIFWELTGFTSYLLIGFDDERAEARRAALQALLVTGGGGLALLAAAVLLSSMSGTTSLAALRAAGGTLVDHPLYLGAASLVLLAAFTKSAQFPFHFWLPNAMQAPTPVSAYLHSATMVKAGVYLVARMTPVLGGTTVWTMTVTVVGALTMLGGAYRAVRETDLKRMLAYSTISALGVLMLLLGVGTPAAVTASLVYLLAHAGYKGALFLVAGAVDHETGSRDVTVLRGLRQRMPLTAAAAMFAAGSMAGVPLFLGFVAKEQFYDAIGGAASAGAWAPVLLGSAVVASALLGAAGLIAGVGPFAGQHAADATAHEAPAGLWLPPMVLAVFGAIAGIVPALASGAIAASAASILNGPASVDLALWHGFTTTLGLSALTIAASLALFFRRDAVRQRLWPRRLGTDRLYEGTLSMVDATSRTLAPLLQSGSLRTYVLVIVLAAVTMVGTALASGRVLPTPTRWTPILLHEALIALLIVGAAVSAVFANSAMGAVLALGTVGYGVASLYALFGAPDLAMTQFAVETLTVVIFVLVFRQMRGFGELSSRLVKARDATVAIAAGALITTLVWFISTSGTTSRLAAYFIEHAPTLGHGRNVVNVILVDFRALDTMGEITVLVTVALGVGALLKLRTEPRS